MLMAGLGLDFRTWFCHRLGGSLSAQGSGNPSIRYRTLLTSFVDGNQHLKTAIPPTLTLLSCRMGRKTLRKPMTQLKRRTWKLKDLQGIFGLAAILFVPLLLAPSLSITQAATPGFGDYFLYDPYPTGFQPLRLEPEELIKNYEEGALRGDSRSLFALGCLVEAGRIEGKTPADAEWYYRRALRGGETKAAHNLALLLLRSSEPLSEKKELEALELLEQAANVGLGKSALAMGDIAIQKGHDEKYGRSTSETFAQIIKWYGKAAQAGEVDAWLRLGRLHQVGLSSGEGPRFGIDQDKAKIAFEKGAQAGSVPCMITLARLLLAAPKDEADIAKIVELFRKAAAENSPIGSFHLGELYQAGIGVEQDWALALEHYQDAARLGESRAQVRLGKILLVGEVVEKDEVRAAEWFLAAGQRGNAVGNHNAAVLIESGVLGEERKSESLALYQQAAKTGKIESQMALVRCFENGEGGAEKSKEKAAHWRQIVEERIQAQKQATESDEPPKDSTKSLPSLSE